MVAGSEKAPEGRPGYALNLAGLAAVALGKQAPDRAFELARRAMAAGKGDPEVAMQARAVFASLVPGYHVPMMNDERRNKAWDRALRRAILPGMQVLEIGTGAGMLALMAARAGAEKVVTCERNSVMAAMATEMAAANGYSDRIRVIAKASGDLACGVDLDRPADLLFCDIFADNLLGFSPLAALSDARKRLLVPGAPVVPAFGAIRLALARWNRFPVTCETISAAGFDISPFSDFAGPCRTVAIGDPGLVICSDDREAFRFDFAALAHPKAGRALVTAEVAEDGVVNGVVQWIRLELDAETVLESRPEPGTRFFSEPQFFPFAKPLELRRGDPLEILAKYSETQLTIGLLSSPRA